jgi:hypothetical protein
MRPRLVLSLALAALCHAETRRALLVGINNYLPEDENAAAKTWNPTPLRPVAVRGKYTRVGLRGLRGAVNDARQMAEVLQQRFGFSKENIVILKDGDATADRILSTLKSFLVDQAKPGDVSFFFYAGHGSRMRNTKSDVASQMDSTILPADATRGVPDIRGKELARIYNQAVGKHVTLTVIQDSCFSGSGARGPLYGSLTERSEEPDGRYVEDPFLDAQGKRMPYPEDQAVLVLSASQDYQPAAEVGSSDLNGEAHGVFTWALLHTLSSVSPDERVETIFQRTCALVQTLVPGQEPALAGKEERRRSGLFGQPASSVRAALVPVRNVQDGVITLGGGYAMGLRVGTGLKRYGTKDKPVEIQITSVAGLNSSEAKITESAPGATISPSDLFQVDRWVAPDEDVLRVYFPRQTPSLADLEETVRALEPLRKTPGIQWIADPIVKPPDYVVSWTASEWILSPPASGAPVKLGARPTVPAIVKAMHTPASLYLLLPPPREMLDSIALGSGSSNDAVKVAADPPPNYVLLGRAGAKGLEYAWALPHLTKADLERQVAEARAKKLPPPKNAMPISSGWVPTGKDAGADLTEKALRLARIRGWIQLQPPSTATEFPYRLALQNVATNEIKPDGETFDGEKYRVVLQADRKALDDMEIFGGVPQRWVYCFVIDSDGRGQLVYPPPSQGSVGNRLPVLPPGETKAPQVIVLTRPGEEIGIGKPFGVDTFYMLATEERIPDPNVLSFDGVRSGERGSVAGNALTRLLSDVGGGRRGIIANRGPVPVNWSVERHLFVSREKQ